MKKLKRGYIQLYTGEGKGKTTAALGQALRALGKGLSVYLIQFMKGEMSYGEILAANMLPGFKLVQYGRKDFINPASPDPEDLELAQKGLLHAREVILSGKYDLVILDEINLAAAWKFIDLPDLLTLLKNRPPEVEIILTGRHAPSELISLADLATEMREIKHYFRQGVPAREGIEY